MSLSSTLTYITRHPLNEGHKMQSVLRFVKWQLAARMLNLSFIYPFTEKSRLIVRKGMAGATGNYYCGLLDFEDMAFLLHVLRPGDRFADIGANVGSYSVLAAAQCGADTIAFEPVPSTFRFLEDNLSINHLGTRAEARNMAIGAEKGIIHFTARYDTINHVAKEKTADTIEVPVDTLDNQLSGTCPLMIKIDVEGYEYQVIEGGGRTLQNPALRAIIIELNGSGKQFGYSDQQIHERLLSFGFRPYSYAPFNRKLTAQESFGQVNTIYLRDPQLIEERLQTAAPVRVHGKTF